MKLIYFLSGILTLSMFVTNVAIADDSIRSTIVHPAAIKQSEEPGNGITSSVERPAHTATKKKFRIVRCYGLVPVNIHFDSIESQCKGEKSNNTGGIHERTKTFYTVSH